MADQQNQTPLQSRAAEPNDKVPRSMGETSQVSVKNQQKDNQDNESRASSDKRAKKAEKLAALDKEFNTNMRLRKIEYEMKQKELEMELHRLEEEGALKLQYEKEALDARDSGSDDGAAPSIRSRFPFNWKSPKSKDVFGWLEQSDKFANFKDCSFDHTKNGHENYRVSFDRENLLKSRSPSGERFRLNRLPDRSECNVLSSSSQLPKLKLNSFDGNPLEWPEWSNMFVATVHNRAIPNSEKMSHLKTMLTGKARAAIASMGYSGDLYGEAWALLERRFGQPYLIVEAQLNTLRNQQPIRMHDSKALVSYSTTISNVVSVLKHYKYEGDLRSSATLQIAIEKLPPNLKEKWWFYVDESNEDRPDPCLLENWLSRMAFVYEGMSQPTGERKEDHRRNRTKPSSSLNPRILVRVQT